MWVFIGILTILLVPYFFMGIIGFGVFAVDYILWLKSFMKGRK